MWGQLCRLLYWWCWQGGSHVLPTSSHFLSEGAFVGRKFFTTLQLLPPCQCLFWVCLWWKWTWIIKNVCLVYSHVDCTSLEVWFCCPVRWGKDCEKKLELPGFPYSDFTRNATRWVMFTCFYNKLLVLYEWNILCLTPSLEKQRKAINWFSVCSSHGNRQAGLSSASSTVQLSLEGEYQIVVCDIPVFTEKISSLLFTSSLFLPQVTVEVADENGDAGASIVVGGYSLSGSVITDGQPTSGVNFVLHAQDSLAAQPGEAAACSVVHGVTAHNSFLCVGYSNTIGRLKRWS